MLDTTLFSVSIPSRPVPNQALIISGCSVILPEQQEYSELDELNYYDLNNNDYGFGRADIQIFCENNGSIPYQRFFVSCVSIRADNQTLCKINRNIAGHKFSLQSYTKATKEGKMAFGISYFFHSMDERILLLKCKSFSIEGFIALQKKSNVYGFMCRVDQSDGQWIMKEGNTYRHYRNKSINSFFH